MPSPLQIIPGRVVSTSRLRTVVEFDPDQCPPPGTALQCGVAILEVLHQVNPSEVCCGIRSENPPQVGAIATQTSALPAPLTAAAGTTPPTGPQLCTGHVGIDTIAPVFGGGSLAIYGQSACDFVEQLLEDKDALVISPHACLGPATLQLRHAVEDLKRNRRDIVWLRNPARIVEAWFMTDGGGQSLDLALSMFRTALDHLCSDSCVIASLPPEPTAITLHEGFWTSVAHIDGQLEPLRCSTRGPISRRRRETIESIRKTLIQARDTIDHGSIFGMEELDDDLQDLVHKARTITGLLTSAAHTDLSSLDNLF